MEFGGFSKWKRKRARRCRARGITHSPKAALWCGREIFTCCQNCLLDLPTKLFAKANQVRLAAGKILFRAGATGDGCYRVEDGLLKVTMVSSSGAERILEFFGPGAIVGELSTIDGLPRSATVVAVRDATLSSVSRAEFEAFAEEHPEVYKSLVKLLARRLRDTDAVVAATSFLSLKGRVARTVLELVNHFGQEVAPGRIVIRQKIVCSRAISLLAWKQIGHPLAISFLITGGLLTR